MGGAVEHRGDGPLRGEVSLKPQRSQVKCGLAIADVNGPGYHAESNCRRRAVHVSGLWSGVLQGCMRWVV